MPKISLNEAEIMRQDEAAIFCSSCGAPSADGSAHCEICRDYWAEVDNGLFSDWEWEERRAEELEDA